MNYLNQLIDFNMLEIYHSKVKIKECLSNNICSFKLSHVIYQIHGSIYIQQIYIIIK
jgi:hypothetical protein